MKAVKSAEGRERGEREKKEGCSHILIDVKEGGHGGSRDGSQVGLVPVHTEHPAHGPATGVVTWNILQQEGLLTATERKEGERRL